MTSKKKTEFEYLPEDDDGYKFMGPPVIEGFESVGLPNQSYYDNFKRNVKKNPFVLPGFVVMLAAFGRGLKAMQEGNVELQSKMMTLRVASGVYIFVSSFVGFMYFNDMTVPKEKWKKDIEDKMRVMKAKEIVEQEIKEGKL